MFLLFDAANTLINKPSFFDVFLDVLDKYDYRIDKNRFQYIHKFLSEAIDFPDKTSKEFYSKFNSELLYALGILPKDTLLNDLFNACSYLPWDKYEDTKYLKNIPLKKAIISNFHQGLSKIIENLFDDLFFKIIISEEESLRKPDIRFFEKAIQNLHVKPNEIIYIGDSVKLDIKPAIELGIKAILIDRLNFYQETNLIRITDLAQLKYLI
jgi:FMN phosphatase YigB (HAD superfamily)